ncbi:MAG: GcrA cell cycle regulator, partial [Rhodobacteraceae bacterium]|nr:GcrA cell cycle regulator [Paracoccaceae bacterium]
MSWTDERVETLKKMWAEGQSASQIAKELGGVTRNAVIGKVHRLGLSNRVGGAPEAKPEPAPKAETRSAAKPAQQPAAAPKAEAKAAAPRTESAQPAPTPLRKQIIPAGQPLPPQPS